MQCSENEILSKKKNVDCNTGLNNSIFTVMDMNSGLCLTSSLGTERVLKAHCGVFQHWEVFKEVSEVFILVPALVGLKGNLEMTLASRLSTAVSGNTLTHAQNTEALRKRWKQLFFIWSVFLSSLYTNQDIYQGSSETGLPKHVLFKQPVGIKFPPEHWKKCFEQL